MNARILIVDDEPRMAGAIATALSRSGYECETATGGAAALAAFDARGADVVVTDWKMPGMDGIELLRRLREREAALPVIVMTAHADVPSAVAAMREGAFDYVTKPFDNDELRGLVARAIEVNELHRENRTLRKELAGRFAVEKMVAESAKTKEVLERVQRVARSKATVLIQGEPINGVASRTRRLWTPCDRARSAFSGRAGQAKSWLHVWCISGASAWGGRSWR